MTELRHTTVGWTSVHIETDPWCARPVDLLYLQPSLSHL